MTRRQYFIILVCALAVLACLFVWRGQIFGFMRDLSYLPAGLLSRVSYIAQMVKSPSLDLSGQGIEEIKRELELEIIREDQGQEQEEKEEEGVEEGETEELKEKVDENEIAIVPLPQPYAGISKERLDWMNLNVLSKEMTRETQVLLKQTQRAEQKSEKAWSQIRMQAELKEIQEEAQTLKQGLDEFSGDRSEITEIQIDLIQVLIQASQLEAII